MTKIKQILFAAGLVAVGYRLGAKSPATAASGRLLKFRDEVAPNRKPSSKPEIRQALQLPVTAAGAPSSLPRTKTENAVRSMGSLVYEYGNFEKKWLDKSIFPLFQSVKKEEEGQLFQVLNDRLSEALRTSNHWHASAQFMIEDDAISVDAFYTLRPEDPTHTCWDLTAFLTQNRTVHFLTAQGACGGTFSVKWFNNKPVVLLLTNFEDGVGALVSAIQIPLDPAGFDGEFEYLNAADDRWVMQSMVFQPIDEMTSAEIERELMDRQKADIEAAARAPANDP